LIPLTKEISPIFRQTIMQTHTIGCCNHTQDKNSSSVNLGGDDSYTTRWLASFITSSKNVLLIATEKFAVDLGSLRSGKAQPFPDIKLTGSYVAFFLIAIQRFGIFLCAPSSGFGDQKMPSVDVDCN
jgi:hypothetical protein